MGANITALKNLTENGSNITDIIMDPNGTKLTSRIWIYGGLVLVVGGTVGNSLSLMVMMRKNIRRHTTALFLMVLAVVDTAILYNWFMRYWIFAVSGTDTRLLSVAGCKIHTFFSYYLVDFEAWILVSVSLERLVSVYAPHRARTMYTSRTAAVQLTVTGLLMLVANLHFFWTQSLKDGICDVVDKRYLYFAYIWNFLDFAICSVIPFFIMLLFNVAIIGRLVYLRKKNQQSSLNSKRYTMTFVLLTVTFVFFLTTGPLTFLISTGYHWAEKAKTREDLERLGVVWASTNITAYTNNAINFVLYCVSGPNFRKELVSMFRTNKCQGTIGPSDSHSSGIHMLAVATVQSRINIPAYIHTSSSVT